MLPPLTLARWLFLIPSSGCTRQSNCIIYEVGNPRDIESCGNLRRTLFPTSCSNILCCSATNLGSGILANTADEVSATLRLQLRTLDDAKKISKSMPILLEGTEKTLKSVLKSLSSFSRMETDVEDRYKSRHSNFTWYEELNLMCSYFCRQLIWILQRQSSCRNPRQREKWVATMEIQTRLSIKADRHTSSSFT